MTRSSEEHTMLTQDLSNFRLHHSLDKPGPGCSHDDISECDFTAGDFHTALPPSAKEMLWLPSDV